MRLPRTLITRHPLGRTVGAPGDVDRQRDVVLAALRMLESATSGGAMEEMTAEYRYGSSSEGSVPGAAAAD